MDIAAAQPMDPIAKIGQQIVVAAQRRAHQRRQQRTLLAVAAATMALIVGVGWASGEIDITGGGNGDVLSFPRTGGSPVQVVVSRGLDRPWTLAVSQAPGGLCIAAAPSTQRADRVRCGAAALSYGELQTHPLTSLNVISVERHPDHQVLLLTGLTRPDVDHMTIAPDGGEATDADITGETLAVSTAATRSDYPDVPEIVHFRPFAVAAVAPLDTPSVTVTVHTTDGATLVQSAAVEQGVKQP